MMAIKSQVDTLDTFGDWLRAEIKAKGAVCTFAERYQVQSVWAWIYNYRLPNSRQRSRLAKALSDWRGKPYTVEQINEAIDPTGSWRNPPDDFSGWLRWTIEQRGSTAEFVLKSGIPFATVRSWIVGESFPLGRSGRIVDLAQALTKWTGKQVTSAKILDRILRDPLYQSKPGTSPKKKLPKNSSKS